MATYATAAELRSWIGTDSTSLPDTEAERLLEKAERDLDGLVVVGRLWDSATGRALVPSQLAPREAALLSNAACAQAHYRQVMGDEFFVKPQFQKVTGPDFTTEGKLPRIAPEARSQLQASGLVRLTTSTRTRPPLDEDADRAAFALQNPTDEVITEDG